MAATAYADLLPPQRLAALDAYLVRLQALGPEVTGTSVAASRRPNVTLNDRTARRLRLPRRDRRSEKHR